MRPLQAERRVATGRGEIVYYAVGSGPPLLFLNGLGASWQGFRSQITHLADRYRCLFWDYRGLFGDCPAAGGRVPSIADHARDARTILEQENAGRAAVLGWSIGAQVALELFADAPDCVALLLLVCGGARASWGASPDAGPIRRFYPALFDFMAKAPALVGSLVQAGSRSPETFTWARRIGLVGPGIDPELFAEVARGFSRLDVRVAFATLREMAEHDQSGVLGSVDVPTLVIGGDRDPFTSRAALEGLVHSIAGAEYLLLPGATHYVLLDQPQHVNLRIDKFFAERGFVG